MTCLDFVRVCLEMDGLNDATWSSWIDRAPEGKLLVNDPTPLGAWFFVVGMRAGIGTRRYLSARQKARVADVMRDVVGNPFRRNHCHVPAHELIPALNWNDGVVPALAARVVAGGLEVIPALSDAIEEAGVGNRDVLDHLRNPGPHTRGCWAARIFWKGFP